MDLFPPITIKYFGCLAILSIAGLILVGLVVGVIIGKLL